jgi:hypothetical protein
VSNHLSCQYALRAPYCFKSADHPFFASHRVTGRIGKMAFGDRAELPCDGFLTVIFLIGLLFFFFSSFFVTQIAIFKWWDFFMMPNSRDHAGARSNARAYRQKRGSRGSGMIYRDEKCRHSQFLLDGLLSHFRVKLEHFSLPHSGFSA